MKPERFEIDSLDISTRARNILLGMKITTCAQLRRLTKERFMLEWRAGERLWEQVAPYTDTAPKKVRIVARGAKTRLPSAYRRIER